MPVNHSKAFKWPIITPLRPVGLGVNDDVVTINVISSKDIEGFAHRIVIDLNEITGNIEMQNRFIKTRRELPMNERSQTARFN